MDLLILVVTTVVYAATLGAAAGLLSRRRWLLACLSGLAAASIAVAMLLTNDIACIFAAVIGVAFALVVNEPADKAEAVETPWESS